MIYFEEVSPETVASKILTYDIVSQSRKGKYYNIPVAFDIETSSFYSNNGKQVYKRVEKIMTKSGVERTKEIYYDEDGNEYDDAEKHVIVYEWQLAIDDLIVYGRNIEDFVDYIRKIKLHTDWKVRLPIYIHNLSYEFQFIRKYFEFTDVFARKERKPIKARTEENIEFRCSLFLTNRSLSELGKSLYNPIEKLDAEYNYTQIRTPETPLTEKELLYGETDVKIIIAMLHEKMLDDDMISIPMTSTGYVRRDVRDRCFKNERYHSLMNRLTIDEDEYILLLMAMSGGFTHANCHLVNKVLSDVYSMDLVSSYPAQMLLQTFPMSKGKRLEQSIDKKTVRQILNTHHCVMMVELIGVMTRWKGDNIISASRCIELDGDVQDNGRIIMAERLTTVVTEIDLAYYKKFYNITQINILDGYYYDKGQLPAEIKLSIVDYFNSKTMLKNVPGQEVEYMKSKNKINAVYGMVVTNIIQDDIKYFGEWNTIPVDTEKAIYKSNVSNKRFLFYPWGVYVTAYSRARVWNAILELGDDYAYSDTDSVKFLNYDAHMNFFEHENEIVKNRLLSVANELSITESEIAPKGQYMGTWDNDGKYDLFKTLGAKRYITQTDGKLSITIAGCNKRTGKAYISSQQNPFEFFTHNMEIDAEHSGRLTHTYIDNEMSGTVRDNNGNEYTYKTLSGVHLEPTAYKMKLSEKYYRLLQNISLDIGEYV